MTPAVVWIGPLPPPVHGASLVTERLLARVRARRADVRVVSVAGSGQGWHHHLSRSLSHLRAAVVVTRVPREAVVYVSLSGGLGLWYQLPLVALARARKARVVVHHHSFAYLTNRSVPMALIARLLRPDDRHLLLSPAMRDSFLARYTTAARTSVVSNAWFLEPPDDPGARRDRLAGDAVHLVHVSNLCAAKGSDVVVETAAALGGGARLTLVGPCEEDGVRAAITAAGSRVRWLGSQPSARVYDELDRADVFVFPSTYVNEAEPLAVLEALSRGLPVIATRRGALAEFLPEEWLVDRVDPALIAGRIRELAAGPGGWAAASSRARAVLAALRSGPDPAHLVLGSSDAAREATAGVPAVLQVLPTFDPAFGGPVSAALGVSRSYRGVRLTTVGACRPGPAWSAFATRGFRSWSSPVGPRHVLTLTPGLLWFAARRLRRFDLVHIHFARTLTVLWLPLLARAAGVDYVLQTHGMCSPWRGPLALVDRLVTRPALQHAHAVCVLRASERTEILSLAPEARVVVVPNVVAVRPAAPGGAAEPRSVARLLFCARLHPRKGLATYLDVLARIGRLGVAVEGHVVGADEGALAAARARVVDEELPVTFHGGLDREGVERWMASCDVLLHPAPGEPFGMSMIEAFAAGLPVVASATSSLADLFAAEGAALLPPDGDVDAWVRAVRRVLDDPGTTDRLRAGGRAVLDEHFSVESLTRVLADVVPPAVSG